MKDKNRFLVLAAAVIAIQIVFVGGGMISQISRAQEASSTAIDSSTTTASITFATDTISAVTSTSSATTGSSTAPQNSSSSDAVDITSLTQQTVSATDTTQAVVTSETTTQTTNQATATVVQATILQTTTDTTSSISSGAASTPAPSVSAPVTAPVLSTDKADYNPGSIATIFGNFFASLQNIVLKIFGGSVDNGTYTETTKNITTDGSGSFTTAYALDNIFRPLYTIVASALDGTKLAQTTFTDAPGQNLDQCQNGKFTTFSAFLANLAIPCGTTANQAWQNGNINSNNSAYREGDGLPYRFAVSGLSNGLHTVVVDYDFTKGGIFAIDRLTGYQITQQSQPCPSGQVACSGSPALSPDMPGEVASPDLTHPALASGGNLFTFNGPTAATSTLYSLSGSRKMAAWIDSGGTFAWGVMASNVTQNGLATGDSDRQFSFSFSLSGCASGCNVMFGWTGHISSANDWGAGKGAGSISGSPFHMRVLSVDGSGGNQDRSVSLSVIINPSTITIHKITSPGGGTGFGFTATGGLSPATFSLDDTGTQPFTTVLPGSYTVVENDPSPYALTGLSCGTVSGSGTSATTSTGTRTVSIVIGSGGGGTVDCTYTNTLQQGKIKIVKNTTGGDGTFNFNIGGATSTSASVTTSGGTASTTITVAPGTYSVSEVVPSGWALMSSSCDSGTPGNFTVSPGNTVTCTFSDTKLGKIILVKNTTGGDSTFNFTTTGGDGLPANPSVTTSGGTGSSTFVNITPGTYSISETVPAGWSLASSTCTSGTPASFAVSAGGTVTCIFNDVKSPTLTLVKTITNDNGGTALATAWTLSASGSTSISGVTGSGAVTGVAVNSGTYTLSESGGQSGYAASLYSCVKNSGSPVSGNSITLVAGDNATCTINNNDIQPKLTVTKVVINHGGNKQVFNFPLFVGTTSVTSGVQNGFNAGTYIVSETGNANYTETISGDCNSSTGSVTLGLGDVKSCTLTNEEKPSQVVVHKVVINHGLSFDATRFAPYKVGTTIVVLDATTTMDSGSYVVSETPDSNYTASFTAGDCDVSGNITLAPGTTKTCTITNEEKPATLTLVKTVVNDDGGTATTSDFILKIDGNQVVSGHVNTINSGAHTASEVNLLGYAASAWGGDCAASGTIALAPGDNKTCTITNDDIAPKLTVVKHVVNDDGNDAAASDFTMLVTGNSPSTSSFPGSEIGITITLSAGAYSVNEGNHAGYTESTTTDCVGSINIGETKTCTITNDDIPMPTRTQGFWATHTDFTESVFGASAWNISTTSKSINSFSRLFAAFYASIPKKSTGAKRSALDQARMQMLQQWVAAKLNCQAFGCSIATKTLIANAATAWAGTNTSSILSYASLLDAYNNSNDALPISGQGKATPKTSQSTALTVISYWDLLP